MSIAGYRRQWWRYIVRVGNSGMGKGLDGRRRQGDDH